MSSTMEGIALGPEALESLGCPLCGSEEARFIHRPKPALPFVVRRCSACGFDYLSPRMKEAALLEHYRSDAYFDGAGYQDYAAQGATLRATFARLLHRLHAVGATGGRLLEVGCGHGYLLEQAAPFFGYRCGSDYSAAALTRAQPHADRLICGGVADLPLDEPMFDCIIANHVIEHVYEPQRFVKDLLSRLRPGGFLLLSTPDAGSLWRRLLGSRWPSYKLPEHILYFDRVSLARLMHLGGAENLRPISYLHAFPLSLVAAKMGLSLSQRWGRRMLWLPGTTLALLGRKKI